MHRKPIRKGWDEFAEWELEYKRRFLRNLSINDAYRMFCDLWEMQKAIPPEELERLRMDRIIELSRTRRKIAMAVKKRRG
jgi:hypothetical protein